jgi:hypothetical protein
MMLFIADNSLTLAKLLHVINRGYIYPEFIEIFQ